MNKYVKIGLGFLGIAAVGFGGWFMYMRYIKKYTLDLKIINPDWDKKTAKYEITSDGKFEQSGIIGLSTYHKSNDWTELSGSNFGTVYIKYNDKDETISIGVSDKESKEVINMIAKKTVDFKNKKIS